MATTGADLYKLFGETVDKDYTEYINPDRFNRLMKNAFTNLCDIIYRQRDTQKEYDELSELSVIDHQFNVNGNRFHIRPLQVLSVTISGFDLIIGFNEPHNLQVGDQVAFNGIQGIVSNPVVNGNHTVTAVGSETTLTISFGLAPTGTYIAQTGRMTSPKMIADYYHLFVMKCRFVESREVLSVYNISGTSVVTISFLNRNKLRTGHQVSVSGVVGMNSANGIHWIKKTGRYTYELYNDELLRDPVVPNAPYVSGGQIQEVVERYADRISSDEKYSESEKPTIKEPRYIEDRSTFKIYPTIFKCDTVTVDYLRKPDVEIDANNDTLDLESKYTQKLLYRLKDDAAVTFLEEIHELQRGQSKKVLTMENR